MLFYATSCALFAGIFIVRYHLELILFAPFAAGLVRLLLSIGLQPNSPAQHPEHLYKNRMFVAVPGRLPGVVRAADVHRDSGAVRVVQRGAVGTAPLWRLG